jgi:bifunctional polynucleotide phosphatase/kinase
MPPRAKRPADATGVGPAAKKGVSAAPVLPAEFSDTWSVHGPSATLYARHPVELPAVSAGKLKVAAFDMDGTLLRPKSGPFPKNRSDWQWLDNVPAKLKALHADGFAIVIFSNQKGISSKKQSATDIMGKIDDLTAAAGVPLAAFFSASGDHYRKPSLGMWYAYADACLALQPSRRPAPADGASATALPPLSSWIDFDASFYCGDAAGRFAVGKSIAKDHSDGDRAFALNAGLRFFTQDQYFAGAPAPAASAWAYKCRPGSTIVALAQAARAETEQLAKVAGAAVQTAAELFAAAATAAAAAADAAAPAEAKTADAPVAATSVAADDDDDDVQIVSAPTTVATAVVAAAPNASAQEVVILVGAPATGKSSLARGALAARAGYVWINQDTLKTKEKCAQALIAALKAGQSAVVDNTNPQAEGRAAYLRAARLAVPGVRTRCLYLAAPKPASMHMVSVRECVGAGAVPHVPDIAINMFYSKLEPPTKKEGFDEVVYVPWEVNFDAAKQAAAAVAAANAAAGATVAAESYSTGWPIEAVFNWHHE